MLMVPKYLLTVLSTILLLGRILLSDLFQHDYCEDDRMEEATCGIDRTMSCNNTAMWTVIPVHVALHCTWALQLLIHEQMA